MEILSFLDVIIKAISKIKGLFWKAKNIIYINENVKKLNVKEVCQLINIDDYKCVKCKSVKYNSYFFYNCHMFKQKINLMFIINNCSENNKFIYTGFASQMFSVYDGYMLGNTLKYVFIDRSTNNNYYKIKYFNDYNKEEVVIDDSMGEINIIVESSYKINKSKIKKCPTITFGENISSKIDNNYLNKVYSFIKNTLDSCGTKNIDKVNLYLTVRQPVAFVIGTAIQSYHPIVNVYNYDNNQFKYYLEIQNNKLKRIKYGK